MLFRSPPLASPQAPDGVLVVSGKQNAPAQHFLSRGVFVYLHHAAEDSLCDLEVEDQAAGIHDGGDEGGRHDGRVGAQLLGGQRQHTAHQLCEDDAEEQRHADDHCVADDIVILAGGYRNSGQTDFGYAETFESDLCRKYRAEAVGD